MMTNYFSFPPQLDRSQDLVSKEEGQPDEANQSDGEDMTAANLSLNGANLSRLVPWCLTITVGELRVMRVTWVGA